MTHWGWRSALVISSAPALLIVLAWRQYAQNDPASHRSIGTRELAELRANPPRSVYRVTGGELLNLLLDRRIALLTLSYFLMRASGNVGGGPPALTQADRNAFASHLDKWLSERAKI